MQIEQSQGSVLEPLGNLADNKKPIRLIRFEYCMIRVMVCNQLQHLNSRFDHHDHPLHYFMIDLYMLEFGEWCESHINGTKNGAQAWLTKQNLPQLFRYSSTMYVF